MSKYRHPTQILQSEAMPPLPSDLIEAQLEIRRLRRQLIEQNQKMAAMWEKKLLDRESLVGQIRLLQEELKSVQK